MNTEGISTNETNSLISTETSENNYYDAKDAKFTTKEKYYYRSIDKFYKNLDKDKIKLMVEIIDGKSDISLRLLDWFVTKHADQNVIKIKQNDDERINVHISYKAQLKSFKKRYFDPFRRLQKFYYSFDNFDEKLLTTIGQLNFFKWAYKYNVIKYVEDNYQKLSASMIVSNREDKLKKKKKRENIKKISRKDEFKLNKEGIIVTAKKEKTIKKECKIIVSFD